MTESAVYLDSSAIIKLVFEEAESDALRTFLAEHPQRVSSVLAQVEVMRTVGRVEDSGITIEARHILERLHLIRPDNSMLEAAMAVEPSTLRTVDAIHLITALSLKPNIAGIVVYDRLLADAARRHGLAVWAPA